MEDKIESNIDFDLALDQQKEIQRLAFQYKREAKKCYDAKAFLSGCILMGRQWKHYCFQQ